MPLAACSRLCSKNSAWAGVFTRSAWLFLVESIETDIDRYYLLKKSAALKHCNKKNTTAMRIEVLNNDRRIKYLVWIICLRSLLTITPLEAPVIVACDENIKFNTYWVLKKSGYYVKYIFKTSVCLISI